MAIMEALAMYGEASLPRGVLLVLNHLRLSQTYPEHWDTINTEPGT